MDLESLLIIELSDSDLIASLSLQTLPEDISAIPYDLMLEFLEKKKITIGLDEKQIQSFCQSPEYYLASKMDIAFGKSPVHGQDGSIDWIILNKNEASPLVEKEDGSVDFYSLNRISNIKKGEIIAQKIPSTKGESGITVTGEVIPAIHGKEATLKPGKNTLMNEEKTKIYAAIDGQMVITDKNKINVFPVYEVQGDLDFSIGNIDFVGTVVVRGNVPDGFKIHAKGDIHVYGNVEGAELIADGDIFIQQGVIGHNKSFIKSKKNMKTSFILDGNVHVHDTIEVSQSIMHSYVAAGNKIVCKGRKGIIVGGKLQAGKKVDAIIIGNDLATATIVEVGINPELRVEMDSLHQERRELIDSQDKVTKALKILDKMMKTTGLPPEKKGMQLNLLNQQIIIENRLKELKVREQEIEMDMKDLSNASIEVFGKLYPGLKLVIGQHVKFIKSVYQHMKFTIEDEEITAKPLR